MAAEGNMPYYCRVKMVGEDWWKRGKKGGAKCE